MSLYLQILGLFTIIEDFTPSEEKRYNFYTIKLKSSIQSKFLTHDKAIIKSDSFQKSLGFLNNNLIFCSLGITKKGTCNGSVRKHEILYNSREGLIIEGNDNRGDFKTMIFAIEGVYHRLAIYLRDTSSTDL